MIVRIELAYTKPPIWRRLRVPSDIKLSKLHDAIQIVTGWENGHLHQFVLKDRYFMPPYPNGEFDDFREVEDERKITLGELLTRKGAKLIYEYDFGDGWEHVLTLEEIRDADEAKGVELLDGKLAGPPEDCGGVPGYYNLLDALSDPKHPDHDDIKEWCGDFDAESLDIAATNRLLKRHCK
jgi:hypothetical protein